MIKTRARRSLGGSTLVVVLASLSLSCSGGTGTTSGDGTSPAREVRTAAPASASASAAGEPSAAGTTEPAPGAERVRDVFARLQATYNDGCTTTGNCRYFLGRVLDELNSLDRAMKADPRGPAHFREPLARIAGLRTELGGDRSFGNLKKHQALLTGTRDGINRWMQGHPEDYR
ncbi:hypothetical protein ACWEN3_02355 [Streptomyces sp. NPDC004561]